MLRKPAVLCVLFEWWGVGHDSSVLPVRGLAPGPVQLPVLVVPATGGVAGTISAPML